MSDTDDLDAASEKLDEIVDKMRQPMVGMRLDVLRGVVNDLDASEALQGIFGSPVSAKLGVIAEVNDLKISELSLVELSAEQKTAFLAELESILKKRIDESARQDS